MSEIVRLEQVVGPYLHLLQDLKKDLGYELVVLEQIPEPTLPPSSHFIIDDKAFFYIHPQHVDYWRYEKDHYRICLTVINRTVNWYNKTSVHKDDVLSACRELIATNYLHKTHEQPALF